MNDWLEIRQGQAPLIVSLPHTGSEIPPAIEARLSSPWLGRKDADHWVHTLYAFALGLGATTVRTAISRTVIDVNRDPSGASLYPGQFTTELCPLLSFDGEPLYRAGQEPAAAEIEARRTAFFVPYHAALSAQLTRLRAQHARVVLYDAHSVRSRVPRLFAGELPLLNLGTYDGQSCDASLGRALEQVCDRSRLSWASNGRFKGGWTTRHYGRPARGVHALQMELACRGYLVEPELPSAANWPPSFDSARAAPLQAVLAECLHQCLAFATTPAWSEP